MNKNNHIKIGIIMQSPDLGGAETYMINLAKEFKKDGNTIVAAANSGKYYGEISQISEHSYNLPFIIDVMGNYRGLIKSTLFFPRAFIFYWKLLKEFKKQNTDVILMSGFTEKLFVSFMTQFIKIPVVWIEYAPLELVFKRNFYIPQVLYLWLQSIPKKIIVPTIHTQREMIVEKVNGEKIIVIPCGTKIFPMNRVQLNRNKKNIVIGCVGRLTPEKGQETLIRAFAEVCKTEKNISLVIVGDGPAKKLYSDLVKELKISKKVTITGFVKDTQEYYSLFDIFINPSEWRLEGFGLVTIEAMAYKIPVIVSDIPPQKEIVEDTISGLQFKNHDVKDLTEKIIILAKSKSLRASLAENGYKRAVDLFNLEKVSSKILEVIKYASQ